MAGIVIRPNGAAPSLTLGSAFIIQEGGGPGVIAPNATISDADSPTFGGGSLTVSLAGARPTDKIAVYPYNNLFVLTGNSLAYDGKTIGTVSGGGFGASSLTVSFNASATLADVQAVIRNISFEFTEDNPPGQEVRVFTVAVNDGTGGSAQADQNILTFATNDAPVFANLDGDVSLFTEDGPAVRLDQGLALTITDADSPNFNGGSLFVRVHTNGVPGEDVLGVAANSGVSIQGAVTVNGIVIGSTAMGNAGNTELIINFNNSASIALVTELIRALTYSNSNPNDPATAARTILISLSDGDFHGGVDHDTVQAFVQVNVARVDDPPVFVPPPPGPPIVFGSGDLSDTVLSADGLRLYSVNSHDGIVNVYRAETGALITSWNTGQLLSGVDLSLDGRSLLATGYQILSIPESSVTVACYKIDLATGAITPFFYEVQGTDRAFGDVAFLDNGLALLSQTSAGSPGNARMKLLNIETGQYVDTGIVSGGLSESLDGNQVFVSRSSIPGGLYDADTGFPASPFSIAEGAAIAYSAEANRVVTAGQSFGLRVFDGNGTFLQQLSQYNPMWATGVNGLAFDESGAFLFVLDEGDDAIYQLRTSDWVIVNTIAVGTFINSGVDLQVGPDMRYFTFFGSAGLMRVDNPFVADAIVGTLGNDSLGGTAGNDTLIGDSGADTMTGGGGDDIYYVDNAGDVVVETAGGGTDTVRTGISLALAAGGAVERLETVSRYATAALDLTGNELANVITGNNGANLIDGRAGNDTMAGLKGNDIYLVDALDTIVEAAGQGNDIVYSGVSFTLTAGAEVEILSVNDGAATVAINLTGNEFGQALFGNAGDNFLIAGGGADALYGGLGNDTYSVDTLDVIFDSGGNDIVYSSTNYQLNAGVAVETLSVNDLNATVAINLTGNEFGQSIFGNAGNNFLIAGAGADGLYGGLGNDTYSVDTLDVVVDTGGNDTIYSSTNFQLNIGAQIEILSANDFALTTPLNLAGNEFDQQIFGNAGDNFLIAGAGADGLYGKGGNDTYSIDSLDVVVENAGEGYDTVYTSTSFILTAGNEVEVISVNDYAATSAINLTGNASQQQIFGNAGANVLNGGAGADALVGNGGADTFAFTTALGGTNVDSILDFAAGTDKIALDHGIFGLAAGPLSAGAFVTGTAAADADDRIVYNATTGQLFFDADGTGAGAAVLFATVQGNPPIAAADFIVI